jgi:hypothetical protein
MDMLLLTDPPARESASRSRAPLPSFHHVDDHLTFQHCHGHRPRVNGTVAANLKTGGFLPNEATQRTATT